MRSLTQITFIRITTLILCVFATSESFAQDHAPPKKHVVVVVWDGMRPDFVTEANCPTLWKLAKEGTIFRNHHSVYPSATNVNGTAIATGAYPGHSGILANQEYRPEIDSKKIIGIETSEAVRKGDEISGGKHVAVPTIAELARAAGKETVTATAKTVGLLQDRHLDSARDKNSIALFSGEMNSAESLASLVELLGPFPAKGYIQKDLWTTKALTEVFWKDRIPDFSLLWLSEPDGTAHETSPGAKDALAAIKSSDDNLAAVLAALARQSEPDGRSARSTTDIFVVSDHGFSTIERSVDLRRILRDAGFSVTTQFGDESKPGDIIMAGNGGTVFFYIVQHDVGVAQRLVKFLQQCDFSGVIFSRNRIDGTFGFSAGLLENEHDPDVAIAFRWNEKKNEFGIPGMINADWNRPAGQGTHATLSHFDLNNMLIAAGPSFRRGQSDDLPTGNVDLAPTILNILGIPPANSMDGRVLSEALLKSEKKALKPRIETMEVSRKFPSGTWKQTLRVTRIGSTTYLDEGNGEFALRKEKD